MQEFSSYGFIIAASLIIILSYFFNIISRKTNIPSVLLLIVVGVLIQEGLIILGLNDFDFFPILEVFGIVGLILIVLEASLDLELKKEKRKLVLKAFFIAFLSLLSNSLIIAFVLQVFLKSDFTNALIYAIPLSIISSAIVIPSVSNLCKEKKEYMIYESSVSDILGIMFFYFLLGNINAETTGQVLLSLSKDIFLTIIVSIVVSYGLIILFQNIKTQVKLFLLIAVLVLLYSIGKMLHLSSLLTIMVFGLILQNRNLFFRGKLKKYIQMDSLNEIYSNFKMITLESSFVVRTFFFVLFGITISLSTLLDLNVIVISLIIVVIIFALRFGILYLIYRKGYKTLLYLSPRGLITILLFYAIPTEFQIAEFKDGILLFVILITSIAMAVSLIKNKKSAKNKEINSNTDSDFEIDQQVIG